jgi:hypothetical protein
MKPVAQTAARENLEFIFVATIGRQKGHYRALTVSPQVVLAEAMMANNTGLNDARES